MKIIEQFNKINPNTFIEDYLKSKGIENIEEYITPNESFIELEANYDNMHKAYETYEKHMLNKSKFGLLVDSDIDGIQSSAIFYQHTQDVDPTIEIETFFHEGKGHGLTDRQVFKEILDSDIDILVIPDASSSDREEISLLKELENTHGWKPMDIIILDHHPVAEGKSVEDLADVVNCQTSKNVVNKQACGTVVTWHFCRYVDYINGFDYSDRYIDHCAVGTVGDIQNLTYLENRVLTYFGFSNIKNPLLLEVVKTYGKLDGEYSTVEDWGWNCNPKLNGIIRSGIKEDVKDLFYALVEPERIVKWQRIKREGIMDWCIVDKILALAKSSGDNKSKSVSKVVDKIVPTIDNSKKVIMIFGEGEIPSTLGGEVANKIQEMFNKPCLVFQPNPDNENLYGGSCRSPIPFKTLMQKSKLFEFAEGHQCAFGHGIKKENIEKLVQYCEDLELSTETFHKVVSSFTPTSVPSKLFEEIQANSELWGKGLECPTFAFKNMKINASEIIVMGKNKTTFKFVKDGLTFIKFSASKKVKEKFMIDSDKDLNVTIIGKLSINKFNGNTTNQVIIEDYEVEESKKKRCMSIEELF